MFPIEADVAVIGAGILGSAAAYHLAMAGKATVLLDQGSVGRGASGTNAGNIHVLTLSHTYRQLHDSHREKLLDLIALHAEAGAMWVHLERQLNMDLGVRLQGGLMVAEEATDVSLLEKKVRDERTTGVDAQMLSGQEARAILPALSSSIVAAEYCPTEGFANSLVVAHGFAAGAREAGARVYTNTRVHGVARDRSAYRIQTADGSLRAGKVINAAGASAASVAASAGIAIEVEARPLAMLVTEPWPRVMVQVVQHVARRLTLKQTPAGTFLIGGGWPGAATGHEPGGGPPLSSIRANLAVAVAVLPSLARARLLRSWSAVMPDTGRFPYLLTRHGNLYTVVGGSTGFTLGPLLGALVAEAIISGRHNEFDRVATS